MKSEFAAIHRGSAALALFALAGWAPAGFWTQTSTQPVEALGHPSAEARLQSLADSLQGDFQFFAYGDQRALADGEWQAMVAHIAALDAQADHAPTLFVLDTGDIVESGLFSDQYHQLRELLGPIRHLPYLVALGNHEVDNEANPLARTQAAAFLAGSVRDSFPESAEQLHWEWSHGPLRILAIDSNVWVYRRPTETDEQHLERAEAELQWLQDRLAEPEGGRHTILALHHPFLQSSSKHRDTASSLWNTEFAGKRLIDLLADGGVDMVLTGHTHTYELFRLQREDGNALWMMNLSGRPRGAWLGMGAWLRRATDIRGKESSWLAGKGFTPIAGWTVEQCEAMQKPERDQFAIFTVAADGALAVRMHYQAEEPPYRLEVDTLRPLLPAIPPNPD